MSNCMTASLRSTQRVLFAPIEMLDSWTHQQDPEMIARPGPKVQPAWVLTIQYLFWSHRSAQAGHLTEKPLDAQLQVPYNRWTQSFLQLPWRPWCPLHSPPCFVSRTKCGQHIFLHCFNLLLHLNISGCGWLISFWECVNQAPREHWRIPLACHHLCDS